jgi:predicted anti-sigma-YlaC factor YlaD
MDCSSFRELVSAGLDGELAEDERRRLTHHLGRCPECGSFAASAADLHRSLRVQAAPPVPDLTRSVLARLGDVPAPPRRHRLAWRIGLGAVGLTQLVLSAPSLIRHPDATSEMQAGHHLNAWTFAFAIGLLVVAWQPWRVRGVLPIATALAAVMVFTIMLDLRNGHAVAMSANAHLLELAGLVLAWGLARQEASGLGEGPLRGDRGYGSRTGLRSPVLPAWLRPGGSHDAWARTGAVVARRADHVDEAA